MTATTPLLDIDGLAVHLGVGEGAVRAVDGVSLRIDAGEAVALVGESGSGKSMTALSVMRLLPASARVRTGRIAYRGADLLHLHEAELRRVRGREIGMVFQDPMTFLNPLMRIGEQIAEGVRYHLGASPGEAERTAAEALAKVRIGDPAAVMERYAHQLSGGMRQRVLIAIAIACRPALLIADEPTTALDVTIQAQIMRLIRDLRRELGSALLLITHDLGLVASYCDRVYVMYAGQIVEAAKTADLFADPKHPYTKGLLRSVLRVDRRSEDFLSIEGQPPDLSAPPAGCRFHPRCAEALPACATQEPAWRELSASRAVRCLRFEGSGP